MTVTQRITSVVLLAAILPSCLLVGWIYMEIRSIRMDEASDAIEAVADREADRILRAINTDLERLSLITSRTQLRLSLKRSLDTRSSADLHLVERILTDALLSVDGYEQILLFGESGSPLLSVGDPWPSERDEPRPLACAVQGPCAALIVPDQIDPARLVLAGPLLLQGRLLGTVSIVRDLRELVPASGFSQPSGRTGEIVLRFAAPDGARYALHTSSDPAVPATIEMSSRPSSSSAPEPERTGHEVVTASRHLEELGWGLEVRMDRREILSGLYSVRRTGLAALAVVILLATIASFVVARSVTRPLHVLSETIHALAAGDLGARAKLARVDELGRLAAALNQMVEALLHARRDRAAMVRLHHAIIESSQDAIIGKSPDGIITSWNTGAEKLYGYTSAEAVGEHISLIVPEQGKAELEEIHKSIRRGQALELRETKRVTKDGRLRDIALVVSPIKDEGGNVIGASAIGRDVTDRRLAEQELARRADELERSNAELERFAYVASHDLQEPLRMVRSYMQLLEERYRDSLDEEASEFIGYAVDGAGRMQQLIEGLLSYSRVESRGGEFEEADLGEILNTALADLDPAVEASHAHILSGEMPVVTADPIQMSQVFRNLLSNALKFRGPQPPRIEVLAEEREQFHLLTVRDNGIGIEPRHAERIFDVFQRLHTRSEYPGTGIGLAICRRIIERHGGQIWVESGVDGGSAFRFTLPKSEQQHDAAA